MSARLVPFRRESGEVETLSDAALVAGCAQGDNAALAALYDRHAAAVHRFLGRFAGVDGDQADDLLQSTFLQVSRAARRFRGSASARTWLFAIAGNVARRHVRSSARHRRMLERAATRVPTPVPDPADLADRERLELRLADAVGGLPPKLRLVFVMCEVEEVPGVEAAEVLGVPVGTIYRRLHDARRRLRKSLAGVWP